MLHKIVYHYKLPNNNVVVVDYPPSLEKGTKQTTTVVQVVVQAAYKQIRNRIRQKMCCPLSSAPRAKAGTRDEQNLGWDEVKLGGEGSWVCTQKLETNALDANSW